MIFIVNVNFKPCEVQINISICLNCLAAGQGHLKIIQWLRENGADPKLRNELGESPVDVARRYGQLGALKLLSPKSDGEYENEEISDITDLPSDIPLGYTEGEKTHQLIVDKNGAIGNRYYYDL